MQKYLRNVLLYQKPKIFRLFLFLQTNKKMTRIISAEFLGHFSQRLKKVFSKVATQQWATAYDVGIFKRDLQFQGGVCERRKTKSLSKRDVIFLMKMLRLEFSTGDAYTHSGLPRNFVRGERGVQQIQLRTGDKENGDLGAVAPYSGVLEAAVIWYKKFHFI